MGSRIKRINTALIMRCYHGVMRYWFPILTLLAACASPHYSMMGGAKHEITLEGIRFVVFHKDSEAEVLRMGMLRRADRGKIHGLMAEAVRQTTGCQVVPGSLRSRIPGDPGEAMFDLDC